jgi:hypothetical protein
MHPTNDCAAILREVFRTAAKERDPFVGGMKKTEMAFPQPPALARSPYGGRGHSPSAYTGLRRGGPMEHGDFSLWAMRI